MKAKKWIIACACLAGSAFAAGNSYLPFDVVIRDFSVTHPDFENYSEEYAAGYGDAILNYGLVGYDEDWDSRSPYHMTCGNAVANSGVKIGIDGKPMTPNAVLPEYLRDVSTASALKYGECTDKSRGYSNGQNSSLEPVKTASCASEGAWAVEVYYTPGMVQPYLTIDPMHPTGEHDMYDGVHIQKLSEFCDNSNFAQWYEDVDGVNFRINKTLDVPSVGRNLYQINYNYNNGGFSPLDSVDAYGNYFGASACYPIIQRKGKGEDNTPINTSCYQWGPQSLTIYCPPYAYPYASSQTDATGANTATLCTSWLANGGPKNPTAAVAAFNSNTTLGYKHLRNYSYTMMGYVKFKYQSANQENGGEVFEFVADDDMWVFVDGVLAEDRGGVHSTAPAPGAVNIKTLAMNNHGCHVGEPLAAYANCNGASDETGWGENSWHHLHFFYAERQDNGASNLLIRSTFAEVAPPKFGWPSITDGWARIENGQSIIRVTVNIELSPETKEALAWQAAANENVKVGDRVNPATTKYAVLVKRAILDNNGQPRDYVIYGLLLTGVSEIPVSGGEVEYEFSGVLVDENGNVVGNIQRADGIAFNYTASAGAENMVYEYWNTHAIDVIASSGKRVEFFYNEWPRMIVLVQPDGSSSSSQNYSSSSFLEHGSSSSQKPSSSSSQECGSSSSQKFGISSSQEYDSSSSVESTSSSSRHHSDDDEGLDGNEDDGKTFVVGTPELSGGLSVVLQGNTLQVGTAKAGLLKIQVFDMVGHVIESVSENVPAGNFAYTFGKVGKGAYIVRVQQGAMVRTVRK